jgi:uncharacterized membrane protein
MQTSTSIAERFLGKTAEQLDETHQKVIRHVTARKHISRDVGAEADEPYTTGQRVADAVARFGGSWTFIGLFGLVLAAWIGLNSYLLMRNGSAFDPYPYILLNLILSMLASIQAPIILMSQKRQAEKDRATALHDYEVNLKAELEIMLLHDKVDQLREKQWTELLQIQAQQLELLTKLVAKVADRRE